MTRRTSIQGWILTEYLNTASDGTNEGATAIGVEAAAETYYSKHAQDLTLPEAATIAACRGAVAIQPAAQPRAALARRNEVLKAMEQQGKITAGEYADATGQDLGLDPGNKYSRIRQPYIFDLVKQELQDRYGVNTVQTAASRSIRPSSPASRRPRRTPSTPARSATRAAARRRPGLDRPLERRDRRAGLDPALLVDSQFNFAAHAQRQPGSSFKVYDLTTAIKQGIDPDTTYYNGSSPNTLRPRAARPGRSTTPSRAAA